MDWPIFRHNIVKSGGVHSCILVMVVNPVQQAIRRGIWQEAEPGSSDEEEGDDDDGDDGTPLAGWEGCDRRCLVIVDTLGIHQLRINWCQCKTAAEPHIQLLRNNFFPASIKRPSTAFTFSVWTTFISMLWSARHLPQAFSTSSGG
jgi:hypothetical protein